ncbi:hypothetical protein EXIGLDRAFT_725035 [Exidia glandulosa HHB12029]|uniref:Uncharacterized protein n=1 Tax=Exidia glandulosa HHB12029 TaxID=1314781 RepID=A0A165E722_EXIGL|nr:hypothetical protein EXIGLDRAFT_735447 [Exidia glandulosa HHB12029]KZV86213.1 hypothetical protein EXIGLDRAFT_725035 [Exidia glandulosa HHB12029]
MGPTIDAQLHSAQRFGSNDGHVAEGYHWSTSRDRPTSAPRPCGINEEGHDLAQFTWSTTSR